MSLSNLEILARYQHDIWCLRELITRIKLSLVSSFLHHNEEQQIHCVTK